MTTPAPVAVEPTKDSGKIEFDKKIKIGQFLDRSRANETRENIKRREAFTQFGKGERGREREQIFDFHIILINVFLKTPSWYKDMFRSIHTVSDFSGQATSGRQILSSLFVTQKYIKCVSQLKIPLKSRFLPRPSRHL